MTGEPTMAALLPLEGTVSVSLAGCEAIGLGTFSIPASATLDTETGIITLWATPHDEVIAAMAEALRSAADELLATIQPATVETIATCPTCDAQLGVMDESITISHCDTGGHIVNRRG